MTNCPDMPNYSSNRKIEEYYSGENWERVILQIFNQKRYRMCITSIERDRCLRE